jgi:hypothetical protein
VLTSWTEMTFQRICFLDILVGYCALSYIANWNHSGAIFRDNRAYWTFQKSEAADQIRGIPKLEPRNGSNLSLKVSALELS